MAIWLDGWWLVAGVYMVWLLGFEIFRLWIVGGIEKFLGGFGR